MSDSFQYLNTSDSDSSKDAASNFLQDKLKKQAKGRYTAEQLERLGQSGGFAVVNSSDGAATDGAPAYDAENPTKNQGVGGAAGNSTGGGGGDYSHMKGDSDTERNYREGNWGKGALDAKALAEKYGLDRSQEGEGDDHIWGTNPDGSKVYIGKQTEGLASNEELIKSHSGQANSEEDDHSSAGEELSSKGDVRGAILSQWKSAGGGKGEGTGEKPNDPIEHSPEIKQAIDRIRTYENDVMSGKLSEDIFGEMKTPGSEFAFDANKGMAGIGTESGVQADNTAARATDSFLDNKKTEVKKEFNFKPAKYGQQDS